MSLQFSVALRNAIANAFETIIGAGGAPFIEIRSGSPPANCAASDIGTLLATVDLPADFMAAASAGAVNKTGTWEELSAVAGGTAGHFRFKDNGGTCHEQGTITAVGGGGDMEVDNTTFVASQTFRITAHTLTAPHA